MNLLSRIHMFFTVKTQAALDAAEDPREALAYGYTHQQAMLQQVRRGLLEVVTARRQLELQTKKLRARVTQLDEQAKHALTAQREDLARLALQRKQTCLSELARLETHGAEVAEEERKLMAAEQQFALGVDAFRTRRDTLTARYTAAEAQVRMSETLSGFSGPASDLGAALTRAEERVEHLQARAAALDALIDNGAFAPISGADPLERELSEMAAQQAVEAELAALKADLPHPPAV